MKHYDYRDGYVLILWLLLVLFLTYKIGENIMDTQPLQSQSDQMIEAEEERVEAEKAAAPELPIEPQDVGGVSGQRLKSFIERVERLEEEKAAIAEDIKEVYGEAKATGFDVKIMRRVVKLRKVDVEKRREEDAIEELYRAAIGME